MGRELLGTVFPSVHIEIISNRAEVKRVKSEDMSVKILVSWNENKELVFEQYNLLLEYWP